MHSGSRISVSESSNSSNSNVQVTITGLTDMGMLTAGNTHFLKAREGMNLTSSGCIWKYV
jgi:hypothetical protein